MDLGLFSVCSFARSLLWGCLALCSVLLAYWAVSRLPSPLLIVRWFWLVLCFFIAVICFLLVATLLWILHCFVFVRLRVVFFGVVWSHELFSWLIGLFPGSPVSCRLFVLACAVFFLFVLFCREFFWGSGDAPVDFGLFSVCSFACFPLRGFLALCAVSWVIWLFPGFPVSC